jgi:hypothetical protein
MGAGAVELSKPVTVTHDRLPFIIAKQAPFGNARLV